MQANDLYQQLDFNEIGCKTLFISDLNGKTWKNYSYLCSI